MNRRTPWTRTATQRARALERRLDALRALVSRELSTRYKGSFFGLLWAILSPLGTVLIFQFVFGTVLAVQIPNFEAFIYSGLLPWVWFSTALQIGSNTLTENRNLVRTPFFSKPVLPVVVTCTHFLLYLFALPVLMFLLIVDGVPVTAAAFSLPAIWLVQGVLTLAMTMLVAAVGVVVRDVQHVITVLLMFWFYLTPIFYSLDQVPAQYSQWFRLNPMTAIVSAHREVTLYGRPPDWSELGLWAAVGVVTAAGSLWIFRALEDALIDEA